MYNLFDQFQVITYRGVPVRNLMQKVSFASIISKTGAVFYPYTIQEGERPDTVAYHYYEDPRYSWLVYMSNNIVDPYYDWPMTTNQFDQFVINKYGSKDYAMEKILFWRDNWKSDDTVKSSSGYEALSSDLKKYYTPVVGYNNSIVNYVRAESDKVVETNKIVELTVANSSIYSSGGLINQKTSNAVTATGEVAAVVNSSVIVVKNIQGAFSNTAGSVSGVYNRSNQSSNVTDTSTISTAIPASEAIYWEYVTAHTYENEINDSKRSIRLIDKSFVDQIERELVDLV